MDATSALDPLLDAAWTGVSPDAIARFGESGCRARIETRLRAELDRCSDRGWAERFAAACPFPGAEPDDFLQRVIDTGDGVALVGIRMRGGDVTRPFVEIVAWTGSLERAVSAARRALTVFSPGAARAWAPGGQAPPGLGDLRADTDQWLYAGRVAPGREAVRLDPVDDPQQALDYAQSRYDAWLAVRPELAPDLRPMGREELDACREAGAARWLVAGAARVGLLCARPEVEREWAGWLVVEEVVAPEHAGRGYAAAGQRALSAELGGAVLWGTILAANAASMRTAERAGRARVGGWWWLTGASTERGAGSAAAR